MKKLFNFVPVEAHHSFECLTSGKIFKALWGKEVRSDSHRASYFTAFRLTEPCARVASPTQGQKCRYRKIAAKLHASPVKSLEIGLYDLLPANEPKLYYTDTSFDTIGQGKSIPLGVGGRFALPDQLPSLSYSLQLN